MIYELKSCTPFEGKEEVLRIRFLEQVLPLFEKHGIAVVALFSSIDEHGQLWYITRFQSEERRCIAWSNLSSDPDWQTMMNTNDESEAILQTHTTTVLNAIEEAFSF